MRLVANDEVQEVCGLCGRSERLTRTDCCGNLICDDEEAYVPFSYARNSCYRNHSNQTICAYHHHGGHPGNWKECSVCRREQPPEMFVWFATNEYNFEKLENPPPFEPTLCSGCGKRIVLPEGGYSLSGGTYWCSSCHPMPGPPRIPRSRRRRRGG